MRPGYRGRQPTPRRPSQQPGAYEERLGDLLDRLALLADRDGKRAEADRTAAEPTAQHVEDGSIEPVETELVDLVEIERLMGHALVDDAVNVGRNITPERVSAPGLRPGC